MRYLDPSNWEAVWINGVSGAVTLTRRKDDEKGTDLVTSGSNVSLTGGTWYTAKVVVDDDLGNAALQRLRFYIDQNGNGSYDESTEKFIDTNTVDDDWSAGYVGLFRQNTVSAATQFDDFVVGLDTSTPRDGTLDVTLVSDNFNSNSITPTYDNNRNLTFDGVFTFTFDAWNRQRLTKLVEGGDSTTVKELKYLGDGRVASQVISNSGVEVTLYDGGNRTDERFYVASGVPAGRGGWNLAETRNGSNQTVAQWVWDPGQAGGAPLLMDKNGDVTASNDCDPDVTATGETGESPADARYFYHTDQSGRVVTLTEYGANNGRVVERYASGTDARTAILTGDTGGGELASARSVSAVGNPFAQPGLVFDQRKGSVQNRRPEYGFGAPNVPTGPSDPQWPNPPIPVEPPGPSPTGCTVGWRCHQVGFPPFWPKFHCGFDIDNHEDPPTSLDYAWPGADSGAPLKDCLDNVPTDIPPHKWHPPFGEPPKYGPYQDVSPCICACLKNPTPNYGRYCLLGVPLFCRCSNSAGALHAEMDRCNNQCKAEGQLPVIEKPWWVNDLFVPGWDNVPQPNHSAGCSCVPI